MEAGANMDDGASGGSLEAYARAAARYDVLSREAEADLARAHADGSDPDAASRLVTSNLRLVMKIARAYGRWTRQPVHDLVQEGNCGLIEATSRYDASRGVRFTSYASWWIRAYMLRFIVSNARLVRIGTTTAQRKLFYGLYEAQRQLELAGVEPTAAELAKYLGIAERDVEDARAWMGPAGETSLDAPRSSADGETLTEQLRSEGDGPDEAAERSELSAMVRAALEAFGKTLDGRDLEIFTERFLADDPPSPAELSRRYGVTRERVRQVEERLTWRLRQHLRATLPAEALAAAGVPPQAGAPSGTATRDGGEGRR